MPSCHFDIAAFFSLLMWREYDFIIPSPFALHLINSNKAVGVQPWCRVVTGVLLISSRAQLSFSCRMRVEEELWGYTFVCAFDPTGGYICQSSVSKVASFPELFMYLILCHLYLEIIRHLKSAPKRNTWFTAWCAVASAFPIIACSTSILPVTQPQTSESGLSLSLPARGSNQFIRKSC